MELAEFARELTGQGMLGGAGGADPAVTQRRSIGAGRRAGRGGALDWVVRGAVGPVVDQAPCNSCAAHAAATSMEFCSWQRSGTVEPLSVQQVYNRWYTDG